MGVLEKVDGDMIRNSLIPIAIAAAGCHQSIPPSAIPSNAITAECSFATGSNVIANYKGDLPLADVYGDGFVEGYERLTTVRREYRAIVDYPQFDAENPPKVWVCQPQKVEAMFCGWPRHYERRTNEKEECKRASYRYNGAQLEIPCGEIMVTSDMRSKDMIFRIARIF